MAQGDHNTEAKRRQRERMDGPDPVVRKMDRKKFLDFIHQDNLYWEDVSTDVEHVCDFMAQINQLQSHRAITIGMDIPTVYLNDVVLAKQVGQVFVRMYRIVDSVDDGMEDSAV